MVFVIICTILSAGLSTYREVVEEDNRPDIFETLVRQLSKNSNVTVPLTLATEADKAETRNEGTAVVQKLVDASAAATAEDVEDDAAPKVDKSEETKTDDAIQESEKGNDNKTAKTLLSQFDELIHLVSL
jgi:hypothetical protein